MSYQTFQPSELMTDFLRQCGGYAVIDGGLATELERYGPNLNDPLWSAKCLIDSPHLIRRQSSGAAEDFVSHVGGWCEAGASLIGGCCRTTPNTIRAISKALPYTSSVTNLKL